MSTYCPSSSQHEALRHITWRGALRSCNYACSYCPFAKKPPHPAELARDKDALQRFIDYLAGLPLQQPISVLMAPYGEALIHQHTQQAVAELSRLGQVAMVSCQTNLSFDAHAYLHTLQQADAEKDKIAVWASFHPTETTPEAFAAKVRSLSQHIACSVVAVGQPEHLSVLQHLVGLLPARVKLRINAMDGLGRAYTEEEKEHFRLLDASFPLETAYHRAGFQFCTAGRQSLFVHADGSCFPCNRSRKQLGQLYSDEPLTPCGENGSCGGRCDCFLAYSNRTDLTMLRHFGPYPHLRLG